MTRPEDHVWYVVTLFVYRKLLNLYPASFRDRYTSDMLDVLRDRWTTEYTRGAMGATPRVWWFLIRDLMRTVPDEHRSQRASSSTRISRTGEMMTRQTSGNEPARRVLGDVAYATRSLRRAPGFTIIAALTLALGIGANAAIFTVVDDVVLNPLPFDGADRVVYLTRIHQRFGALMGATGEMLSTWRAEAKSFDALEGYVSRPSTLIGGADPLIVSHLRVTPTIMTELGIRTVTGRPLTESDGAPDAPPVAVLSEALWNVTFGQDPSIIGREIRLGDSTFTVVGIRPESFYIPMAGRGLQVWSVLRLEEEATQTLRVNVVARLAPGVSREQAQAEIEVIKTANPLEEWVPGITEPLWFLGDFPSGAWIAFGAVGLVLLIACANVANMLLARGMGRTREIGIRIALGASRRRVMRLLATESLILCALGGGLAILMARWAIAAAVTLRPIGLEALEFIELDRSTLFFTIAASMVTALLVGIAPALRLSDMRIGDTLRSSDQRTLGVSDRRVLRQALVVAQAALAIVLIVGTGTMVRSMYRLTRIDPGFDPAHLGIVSLSLPESRYESPEDWGGFFRRLSDRVRSLPSTQSVALASGLVPGARRFDGLVIEGSADTIDEPPRMPEMIAVSPEYFPTIGIPIIRGRHFVPEDRAGSGSVAVINAAFADRYWPGGEALGRRFRFGESGEWMTVVGIAGSAATRRTLQTLPAAMQFYTLHDDAFPRASLVIRAERDMSSVLTAVRELVRELDADLPIGTATSVDQILNDAIARQRFTTTLFTVFAGLALVLATVGVYGVIALSVSQRVNELGVRIALGAGDRHIMRSVFAGGLAPVVLGAVLGIIGAFVLTPQLGHLVFGLDMPDAGISLAVLGLFGAVSALACWIPARRAMRVDPVVALRAD